MLNGHDSRGTTTVLRIVAGAAILGALVLAAGPERLTDHLGGLRPEWLLLAAVLYAGSIVLRGVRLWLMIGSRAKRGDWTHASAVTAFSLSLNSVLPFRMGDISRLFLLTTGMGLTLRDGMLATIIERWFDVAILLTALLVGLSLQYFTAESGGMAATFATATIVPLVAIGVVLLVSAKWPGAFTPAQRWRFWGLLPGPLRHSLSSISSAYVEAMTSYAQWSRLALNAGLTVAIWGVLLLEYGVLFNAMGSLPAPPALVAGFSLFMFTFAVNVIPGQIGTYEALFMASFGITGMIEPDRALALAITIHLVNAVLLALLGAVAYLRIDVNWADLRHWWRHREIRVAPP